MTLTLTYAQKAACIELAQDLLQALGKHEPTRFRFLFAGDESFMCYADHHPTMWVLSWDHIEKVERSPDFQDKTIFTISLNGIGDHENVIFRERQQMSNTDFTESYPEGRRPCERRVMRHFDNVPIHNAQKVQEHLTHFEFIRMKQSAR
jgi:hypothetical protein